jgi:hypothetical protein
MRKLNFLGRFDGDRVLAKLTEYGVDGLKGAINLFSNFGASENNLAGHKDQQNDLRIDHSIDQAWKQFRFVLSLAPERQQK